MLSLAALYPAFNGRAALSLVQLKTACDTPKDDAVKDDAVPKSTLKSLGKYRRWHATRSNGTPKAKS